MWDSERLETGIAPEILYKYTDQKGAEKILSTRTLRFARPSEMNDPFDVRIDEWIGMHHKQFFEASGPLVVERLMARPELLALEFGIDLDRAKATIKNFQSLSEAETTAMMDEMCTIDDAEYQRDFQKAGAAIEEARNVFAHTFGSYGIFCATSVFSNLLMWSHYADRHHGAVLGFRPDIQRDSMLRLMKPVIYTEKRPHGIDSPEEWVATLSCPPVETVRKIADKLLHTKSAEWSYEEEWRMSIPDAVTEGEPAGFFLFHPNEFVEVYLGYRMSNEKRDEIARLARSLNPNVRIFSASLAKRKYALEFTALP